MKPLLTTTVLALLAFAACKSGPTWTLRDPGPLSPENRALLAKAEKPYRKGEPFDEMRAQIVADPVAAWWWARMAVRDVMSAREVRADGIEQGSAAGQHADNQLEERIREGRGGSDDGSQLLKAAAGKRDPVEERGLLELQKLGDVALPCLMFDLACNTDGFSRQNGVDLLARQGDAAMPIVRAELLGSDEAMHRRTGAQFLAARMPDAASEEELIALLKDRDYGVRAAACAGLDRGGVAARDALLRAMANDEDAFTRRAAAKALSLHRGKLVAEHLCDYLTRCQTQRDTAGCEAAQASLQIHARSRGARSIEAWRAYAASPAADVVGTPSPVSK